MTRYYVKISQYGDNENDFITEIVFDAAVQGKNYVNPDDYSYYGEFENAQELKKYYANECAEIVFCKANDC